MRAAAAASAFALAACSWIGGLAADRVLVQGDGWELVVSSGPSLQFRQAGSTSTVSDYARPATLNEAHTFSPADGGVTFVAGPVVDEAAAVEVTAAGDLREDARLVQTHGLTWFVAQFAGQVSVEDIVARDADGRVADDYTLPSMPPPGPP